MAVDLERALLRELGAREAIADSLDFAARHGAEHAAVMSVITSLLSLDMVLTKTLEHKRLVLTADGRHCLAEGSPEVRVYRAVPAEGGAASRDVQEAVGPHFSDGKNNALRNKWLAASKRPLEGEAKPVEWLERAPQGAGPQGDPLQAQLREVEEGREPDAKEAAILRKRKLLAEAVTRSVALARGPQFALERRRAATDLTPEMIQKGTWRDMTFKPYNFQALGQYPQGGHLHPLLKVRAQIRKAFISMGFQEMPTNAYVESSFWNFDALFQPQQHPARDMHDTFFLSEPARTPLSRVPAAYVERVRKAHQEGGYGSIGYGYFWENAEAEKNLLRTHTTAVSSRMLYLLARRGFAPAKYFSIDRVFRNEAIDRTHLAEFHQIEGVVCDVGLSLANLIGIFQQFFGRLGLTQLRFKPAYNPYTEPSMEIFAHSEELGRWIEVGNSGMFRPEMLRPMGLPEDVNVIAWGLSLERPTMILYGIDNIRDLFGHKVSLNMVKKNPICRLGL